MIEGHGLIPLLAQLALSRLEDRQPVVDRRTPVRPVVNVEAVLGHPVQLIVFSCDRVAVPEGLECGLVQGRM